MFLQNYPHQAKLRNSSVRNQNIYDQKNSGSFIDFRNSISSQMFKNGVK